MKNYDFDTTENSITVDFIHIPTSVGHLDGNGDFEISSDDGNESSWGNEKWTFVNGLAILVEENGRDCFDGNLADAIFDVADERRFCDISVFENALLDHIRSWTIRTNEALSNVEF